MLNTTPKSGIHVSELGGDMVKHPSLLLLLAIFVINSSACSSDGTTTTLYFESNV